MAEKIKMTKVELKTQRENLQRFTRYLPTLQLKKQQLQMQAQKVRERYEEVSREEAEYRQNIEEWIELLDDESTEELKEAIQVKTYQTVTRNVAGVDIPDFEALEFESPRFDLFATPAWYDDFIEALRKLTEYGLRKQLLNEQLEALEYELRITTQRVNLFEKVKIPEAQENIRRIQIFLGDQQTFAVGRAKIAKAKAEAKEIPGRE